MRAHALGIAALVAGAALATAAPPLAAQVDPSGAWRTWTTEHFRIHANEALEAHALVVAREAERAYALLARELRPPHGRIDIALHDNVDFSNGFTSVFPSNRIALYLAAPSTDLSLGAYDDWLRLVTTHELAHVFHLDRADGLWRPLRAVFGRNPALFPNAYQPSWVKEGVAVYYETRFTTAGRNRGGFHAQLLGAHAHQGWPRSADLSVGSPVWPAGLGPYAWGGAFFGWQGETYGDSVVPGFVAATSKQVWPIAASGALRAAGGVGVSQGWETLRARASVGADRAPAGRVLASGLRAAPRAQLAPNGRWVAYLSDTGRLPPEVAVYDLARDRVIRRHRVTADVDFAWAADTLYVTQLEFASPVEIRTALYRWRPDGAWRRLTHGGRIGQPFPLPGAVGALALREGGRAPVRVSSDAPPTPLPAPAADDWGRIAASPDGTWLAGARHLAGRWDIVVWPVGHPARARAVTDDAARDEDPAWAPDGSRLFFTSERARIPQIYAYRPGEGTTVRYTDVATGAREPNVTTDGRLMYSTMLKDGHAVAIVPLGAPVETVPALPPPPALVAAAPVAVRAGGFDPWPALLPRYWIPLLHDEGPSGVYLGIRSGGSDPIGRTAYGAFAAWAPGAGRWEASIAVAHRRWRRFTVDAAVGQTWEFAGRALASTGDTVSLARRERFASSGVTWRWRRWRSAMALRVGGEIEQDRLDDDGTVPVALSLERPTFAGVVVTASAAYVRRAPLAISPENGSSVSVLYRRRRRLGGADWWDEWRGTLSGFMALPLPGFARWVLAAQVRGGVTGGTVPTAYGMGGESGDVFELIPGVAIGGGRRSFPLRGYPVNGDRFTRVVTGTLELRIPIALVAHGLGWLPLGLDRVSLFAFGETGGGWRAGDPVRLADYRDVGAEAVWDLIVGYDTALRARVGIGIPLTDGLGATRGDPRGFVALGTSF